MSKSGETAFVKNFKRRVNKKLDSVVEEVKYITERLQELSDKLQRRTNNVLSDSNSSNSVYQQLYDDLENVSENLFAALNIISPLVEETANGENDSLREEGTESSSDVCQSSVISDEVKENVLSTLVDTETFHEFQNASGKLSRESGGSKKELDSGFVSGHLSDLQSKTEELSSLTCIKSVNSSSVQVDAMTVMKPELSFEKLAVDMHSNPSYHSGSSFSHQGKYVESHADNKEFYESALSSDFRSISQSSSGLSASAQAARLSSEFLVHDDSVQNVLVPQLEVIIGETYKTAVVTHVNSPSEFWVQLGDPEEAFILFNRDKSSHSTVSISNLRHLKYFLAPSVRSDKYQRAKLLKTSGAETGIVDAFFIDYGYVETVHVKDLRAPPENVLSYPAQAVCCSLYGVQPIECYWTESSVTEFCSILEYSDLMVKIISRCEDRYMVSITVTLQLPDGQEENSIADMLTMMGLANFLPVCPADATETNVPSSTVYTMNSCYPSAEVNQIKYNQNVERVSSEQNYLLESFHAKQGAHNEIDCPNRREFLKVPDKFNVCSSSKSNSNLINQRNIGSSVSSVSSSTVSNSNRASHCELVQPAVATPLRVSKIDSPFDWNASIPDPKPVYTQPGFMLVNVSAVVNPNHFYVNVVSENIIELDDLREQMTKFYNNCKKNAQYFHVFQLSIDDIQPGIFCCCLYPEDGCWYRARVEEVLDIEILGDQNILVRYIDYGNTAAVSVDELYPLTSKFSSYPAFAVGCSLAGILPKIQESRENDCNTSSKGRSEGWDSTAIERFKILTSKEACFTAEVFGEKLLVDNRLAFDIFLWDTADGIDYTINDVLLQENYAYLDPAFLPSNPDVKATRTASMEELKNWNPMEEDYNSIFNSYGVNSADIEVQAIGYKARDESRICKFFAKNGTCYRGDACPFEHISVHYDGQTQDQEGVFLVDNTVSMPKPGSSCLAQVSYIIDPGHFYLVFPFGTSGVVDDAELLTATKKEFEALEEELSSYYSKAPFHENTAIALAVGTIVAAKTEFDGHWYRARVIDVEDVDKQTEVFFVDYGGTELVSRKDIREIKPEFLFCPFQAVECFLADVAPVGDKWSVHARSQFISLVKAKVLLAHVKERTGSALYVTLQGTSKPNDRLINDLLIESKLAQPAMLGSTKSTSNAVQDCDREMLWKLPG